MLVYALVIQLQPVNFGPGSMKLKIVVAVVCSLIATSSAHATGPVVTCPVLKAISLGSISDSAERASQYLQNAGGKVLADICRRENNAFRPLIISAQFTVIDLNGRYSGNGNYEFFCVPRKNNSVPTMANGQPCGGGAR